MKTHIKQLAAALSALCTSLCAVSAESFTENFNYPALDRNLVVANSTGFSLDLSGGKGLVTKQAGTGNGSSYAKTTFDIRGDFTVTVQAVRTSLGSDGEIGLTVNPTNGGDGADVFFFGSGQINANLHISPLWSGNVVANSASSALLRIRRIGATLFLEYDSGAGFQTLHSGTHTNLAAPLTVGVFLMEEYGSTLGRSGWFDNLVITAEQLVPQPFSRFAATIKIIQPVTALISWPSNTNSMYQVERTSVLTTNIWTPLGSPMRGTGDTMSATDSIIGQPRQFYRVVELP